MSNTNFLRWTAAQQLALGLTILSGAFLGLIAAAPIVMELQHLCAEEDQLQEWLLCELGEMWPTLR